MNTALSKVAVAIALFFMASIAFVSCDPKKELEVAVSDITLSQSSLTLEPGKTAKLMATVQPSNATNKSVSWSSSNDAVATVNEGMVTAVSEGTATITAKAGSKTAACTLVVKRAEETVITVESTVMEIEEEGAFVEIGIQYNSEFEVVVEPEAKEWVQYLQTKAVSNGKMQFEIAANSKDDIRTGRVTIRDKEHQIEPITIAFTQASKMRRLLTEFYYSLDGPNWKKKDKWVSEEPIWDWQGVNGNQEKGVWGLELLGYYLKGQLPELIGEFSNLERLVIDSSPELTGSLPETFGQLHNLEYFDLGHTGMTSLPDYFADLTNLKTFIVSNNEMMTGSLPESLGYLEGLSTVVIIDNNITGEIPSSWSNLSGIAHLDNNCLTGKISHLFESRQELVSFIENNNLWQKDGYGFDISDLEIPGYDQWIEGQVDDIDGTQFSFNDVVHNNKYTVYLMWDSWNYYSKLLMPQIKAFYEKYHKDGLEIIATSQVGGVDENGVGHILEDYDGYKTEIIQKGYDQWFNFYWPDYGSGYLNSSPSAEVYDQNGNMIFSSFRKYPDPVRNRYGKVASTDLIPFLETLFGPAEMPYTSTDFSEDGKVITLQRATIGNGINIVFMGDAYVDRDMASGGLYETVMRGAMEEFFSIEPYKTFRNRFNVYAVKVVSPNNKIGTGYTTALSCNFGTGTTVLGNDDACYNYALKVPGITNQENLLIGVLVNSERNIGTTSTSYLRQSGVSYVTTAFNDQSLFGPVLRHEAGGHGFAFLADEYANYSETAPASHIDDYNAKYEQYGWYSNVDFTNNPEKIRWKFFLSDDRYKDEVGIFEGAALYEKGAYRPSEKSIMRYLDESDTFNAPSRWKIYQQIMERSGEIPTIEGFLEYDAVNR